MSSGFLEPSKFSIKRTRKRGGRLEIQGLPDAILGLFGLGPQERIKVGDGASKPLA